jgi:Leucine-rich repeat (LRR) protein
MMPSLIIGYVLFFLNVAAQEPYNNKINVPAGIITYRSINVEMLANPDTVISISLKKQKLKKVPDELFRFRNLKYLDLSGNKLEEIPSEIGQLQNLLQLDVSNNNLSTLPHEIGLLNQLEVLVAYKNIIALLPESIGELEKLRILDLWNNELEDLPESISNLKSLTYLDLRGILLFESVKNSISARLPGVKIAYSKGCNCQK